MSVDFASVCNHYERAVYEMVTHSAQRYPDVADDEELLADVACVALNRLPPRYIRHQVDFVFYLSDRERHESDRALHDAVEYAFGFVQARVKMHTRD